MKSLGTAQICSWIEGSLYRKPRYNEFEGKNEIVCYIEVIVNDWFVTKVTSVTQFNATFVTRSAVLVQFIKHSSFQCWLFSILSTHGAFVYYTMERHFESSNLKLLQHRSYSQNCRCKQGNGLKCCYVALPNISRFQRFKCFCFSICTFAKGFTVQT